MAYGLGRPVDRLSLAHGDNFASRHRLTPIDGTPLLHGNFRDPAKWIELEGDIDIILAQHIASSLLTGHRSGQVWDRDEVALMFPGLIRIPAGQVVDEGYLRSQRGRASLILHSNIDLLKILTLDLAAQGSLDQTAVRRAILRCKFMPA